MSYILDLTERAWTRQRGPISVIGTWVLEDGRSRPCMVLIRAGEEYSEHTVPCVVTVDKAWIWSEDLGDPRIAARTAYAYADALRLTNNPKTNIFIATLIHDLLGDLLTIPPYQAQSPRQVIAEVTRTSRADGSVHEDVIHDV